MSETKFTPGPWFVHDGTSRSKDSRGYVGTFDIKTSPKGELHSGTIWIGDTKPYDDPGFTDKETAHANAKLIAASPELLAAAEEALDFIKAHNHYVATGIIDKLKMAIAKATT